MRSIFVERPAAGEVRRRFAGWGQVEVWLPVVVAVCIIATESTDTFSAEHTSNWLRPVIERIFGRFSNTVWWWLHHVVRKCGHFGGYGLVCLTFLRAWLLTLATREGMSARMWRWRSVAQAVACTALVASLDEWHQTFIPSRTGTFHDVLLDTCGAMVMCVLVWVICWRGPVVGELTPV
jgi:hypothetical protein